MFICFILVLRLKILYITHTKNCNILVYQTTISAAIVNGIAYHTAFYNLDLVGGLTLNS